MPYEQIQWLQVPALGICPDNELAGTGLVGDALTVARNSKGVNSEVAGEVSIMCKIFLKTNSG